MRTAARRLTGLAVFLLLWEAAGRLELFKAGVLPPASVVIGRFFLLLGDAEFLRDVVATLLAWLITLLLASAIAVVVGLLLGSIRPLRLATGPVIEFLRPLPTVALIPLAILVLGTEAQMKIALATFAAVWPILFNTMYAISEIDSQVLDTARAFRTPRARLVYAVILPSIAPFVLTGIRLSAAVGLIVIVSTEYLTSTTIGVGQFVYHWGSGALRMDIVLAGTIFTGLVGYLVNSALLGVQRRWLGWSAAGGAI